MTRSFHGHLAPASGGFLRCGSWHRFQDAARWCLPSRCRGWGAVSSFVYKRGRKPQEGESGDRRLIAFGVTADCAEQAELFLAAHFKPEIGKFVPQPRQAGVLAEHKAMLAPKLGRRQGLVAIAAPQDTRDVDAGLMSENILAHDRLCMPGFDACAARNKIA